MNCSPTVPDRLKPVEKRRYDPECTDRKEQQKHMAYLLRKGFSFEEIRSAMGHLRRNSLRYSNVFPALLDSDENRVSDSNILDIMYKNSLKLNRCILVQ